LLVTFPTTIAITLMVLIAGHITGGMTPAEHRELLSRVGLDVSSFDLQRVLAMPIATFVQSSPGVRWHMVLLVAAPLAVLEWLAGSFRAAATFLFSDWISAPITLLVIWILSQLGFSTASRLMHVPETGSSAAAHGTISAGCMFMPGKLRYVSLAILFCVDIVAFAFQGLDAALAHVLASIVGTAIGAVWMAHPARGSDSR
jgi:hypothetical protein